MSRYLPCVFFVLSLATPGALAQLTTPPPPPPEGATPAQAAGQEAPKPDKPKWDVNAPAMGVPAVDAPIDTTEGTWMNLDVSPDGTEIVFDLLGDLYLLPIAGGEAKALTSGVAWDMQPRFSPDGQRVAFTSDRTGEGGKGGDNIWTITRDGATTRQITKESFRLVTSPTWTPDGQFIAARKHFTSRRSLGAGEIWLYHAGGTGMFDGLQMTTRPTEEKDVGEPAFSPDGRYLYYSLDTTGGGTFEYNKDSNTGIYTINRLDRQKGETEACVRGPGGAIRPTPSPDGKSLAFVRRVRFKTVLFVMDLASGMPRPVYDGLERDMQETWAIHGVYPGIAWTPDNASIVFWSAGHLHRVDVKSGKVSDIPFHVATARQVTPAVRFPVEVAPAEFDVKMLTGVAVSPKGDAVAYSALGHIYTRALPDGEPKRLTSQNKAFEYSPSYSRDGRWIVYTTWNDEDLGSVRIAPAGGGEGRGGAVTAERGHYVDPVFTPDGTQVLYGKVSGGYLTSQLWSRDTGLYRAALGADGWGGNAPSAKPVLVTKRGTNPQFGAENDRVYLMVVEGGKDRDRRSLISVNLDGAEPRTHLVSENATEYRLSPDGHWVAFAERYNVYIAPFVPTGREIDIGPKSSSLPVAKVTHEAGSNLQWSGDSRTLFWSLGPDLYTRALTDSFAFLQGAPEKLPEAPTTGRNIAFKAAYDAPAGTLALTGARLVTMRGDEVIENGTIVIERNRIAAVGPKATTPAPAGATVIDMAGKTITPGMIDVHAHGGQAENGMVPQKNWGQYANLAFGVTTIHDPSNGTEEVFSASELAKAGAIVTPRIFSTGTILYGAAGTIRAEIDSLEDAKFHLRRMKAAGAFSVKSYNQPRRDQRQQVLAAARDLGMMVVPEGGSLFNHNMTMVVDGHTGIEHSLPVERIYGDVTQLWHANPGVGYTPTLIVGYGGIMGENYWYDKTDVWADTHLTTFVPRPIIDPRSRRRVKAPDEEYNTLRSAAICKALVDAGARVHLGAHGQLAGLGAQWELWMLGQGGLTPLQALRCATLSGAEYLGLDHDLGSLAPGKLADLVVFERSPLENLQNSASITHTMLNGRLYDAKTMARLGPDPRPRPTFFFESLQAGFTPKPVHTECHGCGVPGLGGDEHEDEGPSGYR
jgi:imidazolonepropionase-like amidohydrolase/Tol biopolymer transport system component